MKQSAKSKDDSVATVLRRMRESAGLTMRQVGAIVGISHVAVSQFENRKLDLPEYRIEQFVKAYGLTNEDFNKIIGRAPISNPKDDCHAMVDRLDAEQLIALRSVMNQMLRVAISENAAKKTNQIAANRNSNCTSFCLERNET